VRRLLLDTSVVLWLLDDSPRLGRNARRVIDAASIRYVSAVSIWEIGMIVLRGKLAVDMSALGSSLEQAEIEVLPLTGEHALRAYDIAASHPDPFDRMLLAQAISEPLHLLTADTRLASYSELAILI
jgi:PIN domain nuclease of toxin-antitoxin system